MTIKTNFQKNIVDGSGKVNATVTITRVSVASKITESFDIGTDEEWTHCAYSLDDLASMGVSDSVLDQLHSEWVKQAI